MRPCANCGRTITFQATGGIKRGTEDDLDGPQKQFAALNHDGSPHRCGMGKLRRRTFDELTPEERQRFGIPEKASA